MMEAEIKEIKSENEIQLKKTENDLVLRIKDEDGKPTGEFLRFNLQDIELPLRWQELLENDKKNRLYLKNQFTIIEKRQDHKGKKLLSANEEAKIRAMQEFYKKEIECYNMFLGERGVQKLLNGREISWDTLDEIDEIIDKYIMPKLKVNADEIKKKITEKYSNTKRVDVIE